METVRHEAAEEMAAAAVKARKRKIILIASGAITLVALLGCIACLVIGSLAPSVEPTSPLLATTEAFPAPQLTPEPTGTYVLQVITTEANADNATAAAVPVVVATATLAPAYTSIPFATLTPTVMNTPVPLPTYTPQPTLSPPPTAVPTSPPPVCDCSYNRYNCPDFGTQREAQSCYDYCRSVGAGDVHRLDADNDNQACESLP